MTGRTLRLKSAFSRPDILSVDRVVGSRLCDYMVGRSTSVVERVMRLLFVSALVLVGLSPQ